MRRHSRWMTTLGVACVVPVMATVAGQDDKPAADKVVTTKKVAEPKVDVKEARPAMKVVPAMPIMIRRVAVPLPAAVQQFQVDIVQAPAKLVVDDKKAEARKAADAKRTDILAKAFRAIEKAVSPEHVVMGRAAPVAPVAVRFKAVAAVADGDLDPMAAQWLQQFTPMVRTELHFLLSVSQATPEQKKALSSSRTKIAKEAAKLYAQSQQRIGRFQGSNTYPQPRALVQESLTKLAATTLSPEQMDRYTAELKKRDDDQKKLAIKNIVAKMDQDLVLSADQREKLDAALSKNWNASWCQSLESFMYGDQFFPAIPDNIIVPHLNEKQAVVWKGTQRNGGVVFGGFGFGAGLEGDDFPDDESVEEPKAPAAPAEKPKADAVKVAPAAAAKTSKDFMKQNAKPKS